MTYAAGQSRVDHDPVTGAEGGDCVAGSDYLAGGVATQDQRRRKFPLQTALTLPGENVQSVQRAGAHAHHHVRRPGRRVRAFPILQDPDVSVGFDVNGSHGWITLLVPSLRRGTPVPVAVLAKKHDGQRFVMACGLSAPRSVAVGRPRLMERGHRTSGRWTDADLQVLRCKLRSKPGPIPGTWLPLHYLPATRHRRTLARDSI